MSSLKFCLHEKSSPESTLIPLRLLINWDGVKEVEANLFLSSRKPLRFSKHIKSVQKTTSLCFEGPKKFRSSKILQNFSVFFSKSEAIPQTFIRLWGVLTEIFSRGCCIFRYYIRRRIQLHVPVPMLNPAAGFCLVLFLL